MEIAVVGAGARRLCQKADIFAQAFPALANAAGRSWDLLALAPDAADSPFSGQLRVGSLLLPGDSDPIFALRLRPKQVIGYGLSPRDTLTLSSFTGLLCLQRSLLTLGGTLLEPMELPLPSALSSLPEEDALLVAGLRLLCSPPASPPHFL